MNVTINIFSVDGRIIRIIRTKLSQSGYTLTPVIWDGNDESGRRVGKGMYPYSVTITTLTGETARASGRMIIL